MPEKTTRDRAAQIANGFHELSALSDRRDNTSNRREHDNRRAATRVTPDAVPWIESIKPASSDSGRMIDISHTGVLLETNTQLRPGRRSAILVASQTEAPERVEAVVVRCELLRLPPGGVPVYRAALTFAKPFDLRLADPEPVLEVPVTPNSEPEPAAHQEPRLVGPFDALWGTEAETHVVAVSEITEGGCVVHAPSSVPVGETGAVQVFFSPVRQLLLTGKVARILENGACVFRFINLTAEQRRALRVEIAGCAAGSSAMSGHTSSAGPAGLRSHLLPTGAAMPAQVKTFHINAW